MNLLKLTTITPGCILTVAHRLHAQLARDTTRARVVDSTRVVWGYGRSARMHRLVLTLQSTLTRRTSA